MTLSGDSPRDATPNPGDGADRDDDAPSPEFGAALDAFEHAQPPAAAPPATNALPVGTAVHGKVVSVNDESVMVDFGGRSEGIAETRHFRNEDGTLRVSPGDPIDLFVVETGDEVKLAPSVRTRPKADKAEKSHEALRQVREAQAAGMPVSGRVTVVNSGGLAVDVSGVRGFCPMSQIELGYCADPSHYVVRTLDFIVTSVEEARGSAVLSRRKLLKQEEEQSARRLAETLQVGDERDGVVRRLEPFGAFVDIGGADGLVHVSEIRHGRVGHPKQVLQEGQTVRVKVLRIDASKEGTPRISLSMKAAEPDPWVGVEERFPVGATVSGTVARLTDFGAFVTLAPGVDGLVHVSEIARERIAHPKDALKPGQTVEAVVQSVDPAKKRVSLSIKKTLPRDPMSEAELAEPAVRRPVGGGGRAPRSPRNGRESREGREPREGRRERDREPRNVMPPQPAPPAEPTTMAIALRKALEEARKREEGR